MDECLICREEKNEVSRWRGCEHSFCKDCTIELLYQSSPMCPLCRNPARIDRGAEVGLDPFYHLIRTTLIPALTPVARSLKNYIIACILILTFLLITSLMEIYLGLHPLLKSCHIPEKEISDIAVYNPFN